MGMALMTRFLAAAAVAFALGAPGAAHAASCLPEFTPREGEAYESQTRSTIIAFAWTTCAKPQHNCKACAARDRFAYDLHHQAE